MWILQACNGQGIRCNICRYMLGCKRHDDAAGVDLHSITSVDTVGVD